jgi:hypothetical protein
LGAKRALRLEPSCLDEGQIEQYAERLLLTAHRVGRCQGIDPRCLQGDIGSTDGVDLPP